MKKVFEIDAESYAKCLKRIIHLDIEFVVPTIIGAFCALTLIITAVLFTQLHSDIAKKIMEVSIVLVCIYIVYIIVFFIKLNNLMKKMFNLGTTTFEYETYDTAIIFTNQRTGIIYTINVPLVNKIYQYGGYLIISSKYDSLMTVPNNDEFRTILRLDGKNIKKIKRL